MSEHSLGPEIKRFLRKQAGSIHRLQARRELYGQIYDKGFPPILWSKGYAALAEQNGGLKEVLGRTEKRWDLKKFLKLYNGNAKSYWIPLTSHGKFDRPCPVDWFAKFILPKINSDFVLITTDGPAILPYDVREDTLQAILKAPRLKAWFSQNVVNSSFDKKLKALPLGIDLHTDRGCGVGWNLYENFCDIAHAYENKKNIIVADCFSNINSNSRREVFELVKNDDRFQIFEKKISQLDLWKHYSQSKYVLSLEGVGADCHRTWEALYMGAVVIGKHIGLDSLFKELPVYPVSSWDEIKSPDFLRRVDSYVEKKRSLWDFSLKYFFFDYRKYMGDF